MKSESTFALENASWPALLVTVSGDIRAASQGAKKLFGQALTNNPSLRQSIWSRENAETPEEFLGSLNGSTENSFALRFKSADGSISTHETHFCAVRGESQDYFLLQIFQRSSSGREPMAASPRPGQTSALGKTGPEGRSVLEASIAHKQKLDCAMQLIRTVALDFNNALTSILGHASWSLSKIDPKNPLRNSLIEIEKSALKAAEIANDLAAFSRQEKDNRSQTSGNLNDLLRRTVEVFKEGKAETINWKLDLQSRPYAASFDEAKMQQVFIKILENAVQALGHSGTIYLSTRNLELSEPLADGNARLNPGAYICVEVSDTGKGIPPDLLPRIFEPFFTTKKSQGHRGLGLAWVYGIVTNHAGTVAVASEPGKGTAFRVYLPAQTKVMHDAAADDANLGGSETILLIDDEDLLLTMGEMVLSSSGYRVFTASNGHQALEIFSVRGSEIDLVITDLVMPQMSGRELIDRLRRIVPTVKIICSSGFVRPPSNEEQENYLQKPFASQDLLRKVRQVLSAGERAN